MNWPFETLPPGLYFDLDFDEYLAQPCIQSSSIKQLLISESDFWFRSWMNPLREEDDETKAKKDGTAYHKRILEGRDAFYSEYTSAYEDDGDPDMLRSTDDIKAALKAKALPVTGNKLPLAERLRENDPSVRIMLLEEIQHNLDNDGKIPLNAKDMRYIELMAHMIENHHELKSWLVGGYPEVTVIWDDPMLKVRCKARFDYMKIGQIVDLKTFANQRGRSINLAIERTIAEYKYHIQAWFYLRGIQFAKQFAGKIAHSGTFDNPTDIPVNWLDKFSLTPCNDFWYIFAQKGQAPLARGAKWTTRDTKFMDAGKQCVQEACERFRTAFEAFGTDPWVDDSKSLQLSYESMPGYIMDI